MTCLSGGTIEVYIEPFVTRPRLLVVGQSAIGNALAQLGSLLRFEVVALDPDVSAEHFPTANRLLRDLADLAPLLGPQTYVVVATHGAYDEDALQMALDSDAAYVALVASRRRAEAVAGFMRGGGMAEERIARLRAPAGLDLGAAEPAEIALSILAEIVLIRRRRDHETTRPMEAMPAIEAPATAIDPVCGMEVEIATARFTSEHDGRRFYFCCAGCRRSFEKEPQKYLAADHA
jgi:xanthine dehydrogenase accessory factor